MLCFLTVHPGHCENRQQAVHGGRTESDEERRPYRPAVRGQNSAVDKKACANTKEPVRILISHLKNERFCSQLPCFLNDMKLGSAFPGTAPKHSVYFLLSLSICSLINLLFSFVRFCSSSFTVCARWKRGWLFNMSEQKLQNQPPLSPLLSLMASSQSKPSVPGDKSVTTVKNSPIRAQLVVKLNAAVMCLDNSNVAHTKSPWIWTRSHSYSTSVCESGRASTFFGFFGTLYR